MHYLNVDFKMMNDLFYIVSLLSYFYLERNYSGFGIVVSFINLFAVASTVKGIQPLALGLLLLFIHALFIAYERLIYAHTAFMLLAIMFPFSSRCCTSKISNAVNVPKQTYTATYSTETKMQSIAPSPSSVHIQSIAPSLLLECKNKKHTKREISEKWKHLLRQQNQRDAMDRAMEEACQKEVDEDGNPTKAFILSDAITKFRGHTPVIRAEADRRNYKADGNKASLQIAM